MFASRVDFLYRFLKNLRKVDAFRVSHDWPLHVVIVFYIFAEFSNELPTIPLIVYPSATIVYPSATIVYNL